MESLKFAIINVRWDSLARRGYALMPTVSVGELTAIDCKLLPSLAVVIGI
jgi:hypothetical protein